MTEEEGRESEGCSPFAKINPVRRLCRLVNMQAAGTGVDCVVVCPAVLRQVCSQMRLSKSGRGVQWSLASLATVKRLLVTRPYWSRCLCGSNEVPSVGEKEVAPLLSLTPSHRFVVFIVTSSSESLGSVVVGGESLIQAVYRAQNLPGLRPCLQSPSEPSLAFVKYDMTKGRMRRREHSRGVAPTLLNGGHIKIGMILIYQQTRMLYSGFPLDSYGCSKQDFLKFVSKCTQHTFLLKIPGPPSPQLSRDSSFEEQEDVAAHSDAQEESTFSNPAADE
ncbi:uncharacterized protein LOC135107412 [Scylla paramamosain]|uniref:uncharacterized protein LOC135107412 n=1 Tax=Scylla paramamosain TaxID=85552 RepID=UPI0030839D0D